MNSTPVIEEWVAALIRAVEAAGPQRIEIDGMTPMMVLPLDTYRTLAGSRPAFIDMLRNLGVPEGEAPGEQTPFNVAGCPVPHKH